MSESAANVSGSPETEIAEGAIQAGFTSAAYCQEYDVYGQDNAMAILQSVNHAASAQEVPARSAPPGILQKPYAIMGVDKSPAPRERPGHDTGG